jgi:hypothetical protein
MKLRLHLLCYVLLPSLWIQAQNSTIKGRVKEYGTGVSLPFVSISTHLRAQVAFTDMDGRFTLPVNSSKDSVTFRFLGYLTTKLPVSFFERDSMVWLKPNVTQLHELVVVAGVNPAHHIIRKASENRSLYDVPDSLRLQYASYTKSQVDIANLTPRFRSRKFVKQFVRSYDRLAKAEHSEVPNLPVYISENSSQVQADGIWNDTREKVEGILVNFVGKNQADLAAQLSGSGYQNFNFNRNSVSILRKSFLSPLATSGLLMYEYRIIDTVEVNGRRNFRIRVEPKNPADLLFTGMVWIEDSTYALTRTDLEVSPAVNLNFVNRLHISQELTPTIGNIRTVSRMNLFMEVVNFKKDWFSFLFRTTVVNQGYAQEPRAQQTKIQGSRYEELALRRDTIWWKNRRQVPLSEGEKEGSKLIDTLSDLPLLKGLTKTAYTLSTGYLPLGVIELGSLPSLYGRNAVEGDRLNLNLRTSRFFSTRIILRSSVAYGMRDRQFKYNVQAEYLLSRQPWIKAGIGKREDNDQFGVNYSFSRSPALGASAGSLYNFSAQIGNISKLNRNRETRIWFDTEPLPGLQTRIVMQHIQTSPLFAVTESDANTSDFFRIPAITSEIRLEGRWHPNESFIQYGNERISLGNTKTPTLSFVFTKSVKGIFGSSISYHKLWVSVKHRFNAGFLGFNESTFSAGKIFGAVPYSLLEIHRGNETGFYSASVFNTMQFFEFVSDQFVSFSTMHNFQGLLFNRIPLLKKLRWRELITCKAVYGTLSSSNKKYEDAREFSVLTSRPFVEAGVGIDNIFKILRVDFMQRFTYMDAAYLAEYARFNRSSLPLRFAVKVSLAFGL